MCTGNGLPRSAQVKVIDTSRPELWPGPGQGRRRSVRAAVGSEDARKIDSTWHIQTVPRKRELGLSQLTRVMYAVGRKWAR